jgi:hypothetical protein
MADYSTTAAWLAIAATLVSAVALLALHPLSPEYPPSWRMISEYANGRHKGVLTAMFLAWALASVALAWALRPLAGGWAGGLGLALLVLAGIGQAMGGLFDINHRLHGVAFAVGVPALPLAALLLTLAGRRAGLELSWLVALLPLASVVLMAASMAILFSTLKTAGIDMAAQTGPLDALPPGVTAWNGWANRLLVVAYYLWVLHAARAALAAAPAPASA